MNNRDITQKLDWQISRWLHGQLSCQLSSRRNWQIDSQLHIQLDWPLIRHIHTDDL